MDFLDTFDISGSGLSAERIRLQTIAANLANARTTRTAEGGPYQRRTPLFEAEPMNPFGDQLEQAMARVNVTDINVTQGAGRLVYEPSHPDANADGYVLYPDINLLSEMVDMMTTSRSYEANANAIDVTRELANRALEIGR